MQFDASQIGQGAIGNVHQPAGNSASQYLFQCEGHRRRSFAPADDLNPIEGGSVEALPANTHGFAVEIEMLPYGAFGVCRFKRGAKDSERVASEPGPRHSLNAHNAFAVRYILLTRTTHSLCATSRRGIP
jgi:hypothetical protein